MSDAVKVEVRRSGRRFDAEAVLDLAADEHTVWQSITDYSALPRFMPGIRACRVVERKTLVNADERLVVEQKGEFRFLVFAQSMTVMLDIEHRSLRVAEAKASSFDLGPLLPSAIDVFEGRYELMPQASRFGTPRVKVRYTAAIGLRLPPPPAIGSVAVRQNLATQLQALAGEVGRRGAEAGRRKR